MSLIKYKPKFIYFDIQVTNYVSSQTIPPRLSFVETRTNPFLIDPQDYTLSIIRFQLDTPSLPIFVPEIALNQLDSNRTIYSLTLEYDDFKIQQFIEYYSPDISIPQPPPPNPLPDNSSGYYNIYSYQYFINMINKTFIRAFDKLVEEFGAENMPTTNPPFLSWDSVNNVAIINADKAGYANGENLINIYFNNSLFNLFSSFLAIYEGYNVSYGMNKMISIENNLSGSNTIQLPIDSDPLTPTYTAIQMVQEYSTISLWSPISSIVFTSNTLPIVATQVGTPVLFYDANLNLGTSSANNFSQIITDMIATDCQYKPTLICEPYYPREVDLIGTGSLNTIDINCFYKTKLGQLQPFVLNSGCSASIKIMFSRNSKD